MIVRVSIAAGSIAALAACNGLLGLNDLPTPIDASLGDAGAPDVATADASSADAFRAPDAGADVAREAAIDATPHDACTAVPGVTCDNAAQCGCAPGLSCGIDLSQLTACGAAGADPEGAYCDVLASTPTCGFGLFCLDGICRRYCREPDFPCTTSPFTTCVQVWGSNLKPVPFDQECMVPCDLVDASVCDTVNTGAALVLNGYVLTCVAENYGAPNRDCRAVVSGTPSPTCDNGPVECAPGHGCAVQSDGGARCKRWCHVGKTGECPDAGACTPVSWAVFDGVGFGRCP